MTTSGLPVSRRAVLGGTAAAAAAATIAPASSAWAKPVRLDYPFTLGVASGDPEPGAVVLWTRLAPEPFATSHGMRGADEVPVRWEVANDEAMTHVVRSGQVTAYAAWAHSVHVDATGLQPASEYWYRFEAAGHVSPVGRTRTAPAAGADVSGITFASVSCQAFDNGFFTSYPHIVEDDPDFVLHLGDYVYEYGVGPTSGYRGVPAPKIVQQAPGTLAEWRATHALYKQDPHLQEAHRLLPFVLTWDDHEYMNDYAGTAVRHGDGGPSPQRAAAYQAYWEHQPLRAAARLKSGEYLVYRRLAFGSLLQLDMLDGRQYRSIPPCGWGEAQACEAAYDPAITMLGTAQEEWLYAGLSSGARWNAFGNNVMIARLDHDGAAGDLLWNDAWDGFPAARNRLLAEVVARDVRNAVFVTGDWHSTFVNDVKQDFDAPDSPVVASEFVGTSVTTNGDGLVYGPYYGPMIGFNPHIKYFEGDRRGYQRHTLTADAWRTDLVMVDRVGTPTSAASVLGSWVVQDGVPGPVQA
jgi:alkaline phosphatase D